MATTARTAWRRTPWRSTKAFWAPMALEAGRLVALVPERGVDVPLYWQQWKLDSPALAAVARAVATAAAEALHG